MEDKKYRGITFTKDLIDEIEKYIESDTKYHSIAEFMSEAARLRLQELQKEKEA